MLFPLIGDFIAFGSPRRQPESKNVRRWCASRIFNYSWNNSTFSTMLFNLLGVRLRQRAWRQYVVPNTVLLLRFANTIMFGSIDRSVDCITHHTVHNRRLFHRCCFNRSAHKKCVTKNYWHVDLLFPVFVVTSIVFFLFTLNCNRFFCRVVVMANAIRWRRRRRILLEILNREIEIAGLFIFCSINSFDKNKFQYSI